MKSPTSLNYEIRPCKFVERKMLLSAFARIIPLFKQEYQYVGFGGLSFTDFKLFHRELHINRMYSIEGAYTREKIEFNKPYSCIQILCGQSTDMLSQIDLSKPSIVWLDYDGCLSTDIFKDLEKILMKIPHGSIFLMSCNRQLRNGKNEYTKKELEEIFGDLVPVELEANCCADINASSTIKKMLENDSINTIKDRNRSFDNKLKFRTLFNFKYQESRGAKMYSFGGIILNESYDENKLNIDDLGFICSGDDPYEIDIPNLTYKEAHALNQILNNEIEENKLVGEGILTKDQVDMYKKSYKYLPNFYDVRL